MAYTRPSTMDELRAYVLAPSNAQAPSADTVQVDITHSNLKGNFAGLRFSRSATISELKNSIYQRTGTLFEHMSLTLKNEKGLAVASLDRDDLPFAAYGPRNGFIVHVTDTDPHSRSLGGWLQDTSLVKKYEMSDADYDRREGTLRAYKRKQRLETSSVSCCADKCGSQPADLENIQVGSRCMALVGSRRGTVRFVGSSPVLPAGVWVGVEFDEPVGRNDGSAKGERFFSCGRNFGEFMRPDKVAVGDYPPLWDEELDGTDDEL